MIEKNEEKYQKGYEKTQNIDITTHDFWNYAQLKEEGCIDMDDIDSVVEITGLSKIKVERIKENYYFLKSYYGVEKKC